MHIENFIFAIIQLKLWLWLRRGIDQIISAGHVSKEGNQMLGRQPGA
jgi:hypothetical protein